MKIPLLPRSSGLQERLIPFRTGFSLQFITHYTESYDYTTSARLALEGGCRWIQLRMKEASDEEFRRAARKIRAWCTQYNAIFLLNDRAEWVTELQADGVHLGKNDLPVREARKLLGETYIIGGTANTFEEISRHAAEGADYAGCGPFRYTLTKKNLSPVLGLEGYQSICDRMKSARLRIPLVAIGGITQEDIPAILSKGVSGIALSGTILRAKNPQEETRNIKALIQSTLLTNRD